MQRPVSNRLYPEATPYVEHRIKVSDVHTIYAAAYGNPDGIPVVAVHGGPGTGSSPYAAQLFNPERYHVILIDQRGAGLSTPQGEMKDNTTQYLIADMETVRELFKLERWAVLGGSWGSTLALLYAETHPERVTTLILRGIFLARAHDMSAFVRDGSPSALLHHNEWEGFKAATMQLVMQTGRDDLNLSEHGIYHIYYELLQNGDDDFRVLVSSTLAGWERFNCFLIPDPANLIPANNADGSNTGLTEATYFENGCYIEPNQILNNIARLRNIPVYIVQGIYDLVCPSYMADELEAALLAVNSDKSLVVRRNCIAGHSHKDEALASALVEVLDEIAMKY